MSRGQYPATRMRRNRMLAFSRRLVAENTLSVDDLIWPLFVVEGEDHSEPVEPMPGVNRHSIDRLVAQAQSAVEMGIPLIAIFPAIEAALKDADGSLALDGDNLVGVGDILQLLGSFGCLDACGPADVNFDNTVNVSDVKFDLCRQDR